MKNALVICATALVAASLIGCNRNGQVEGSETSAAPSYNYNTIISMTQAGNSADYRISGWSQPEEKFTWTEGTLATLRARIPKTESPVTLRMRMAAMIKTPELPFQLVEVEANGQKIAHWQVSETSDFTANLPAPITKLGGVLAITLKIPKAVAPKTLGASEDSRVLGLSCFEFVLMKSA